ncbi:MAG: hypothetical protein R3B96_04035 [Pirellulaceae bacterium]
MIVFRCPTLVRFDPKAGEYVACGEELRVDDSSAGGLTECTACGELVSVPSASPSPTPAVRPNPGTAAPQGASGANTKSERAPSSSSRRPPSTVGTEERGAAKSRTASNPRTATDNRPTTATTAKSAQSTVAASSIPVVVLADEDEASSDLPQAQSTLRVRQAGFEPCRICLTPLPPLATTCPKCNAPRRSIMGRDMDLEKMKVETTGFLLSLERGASSGLKAKHMGYTAIAIIATLSIFAFGLGVLGSTTALGVIGIGLGVFWAIVILLWRESVRIATVPGADLGWVLRPLWNLVGFAMSLGDWNLRGKIPPEERIELRGREVTDQTVLSTRNISKVRYIDLRKSSITDETVRSMRGFVKLRFLRLNGTNVSAEQVFRLQQTIPQCWIWW